jgi:WD40 repeat protein
MSSVEVAIGKYKPTFHYQSLTLVEYEIRPFSGQYNSVGNDSSMSGLSDDIRCGTSALRLSDAPEISMTYGLTFFLLIGALAIFSGVTAQCQVPQTAQPPQVALQFNTGHPDWVAKVASDLPHWRYASVGYDGTVDLWDFKTKVLIATLPDLFKFPLALTLTSDGLHLAIANENGDITVFATSDLKNRTRISVPRYTRKDNGLPNNVRSVAIASDLNTAALGTEDGTIVLFDLNTKKETARWSAHAGMVTDIMSDSAWHHLASGSQDGKLVIWDLPQRKALLKVETGASMASNPVNGFGFSADGSTLYVAAGRYLRYVSVPTEPTMPPSPKLEDLKRTALAWCGPVSAGLTSPTIDSIAATGKSDRVVVGCQDGAVKTAATNTGWDPVYGVQDRDLATVAFDDTGKHLVLTTWNNVTVSDWNLTTGERVGHWKTDQGWGGAQVTSLGSLLYTNYFPGGGIKVQNLDHPDLDGVRIGDEGNVRFTPDGTKALVRRGNGIISLYDLQHPKLIWQFTPQELRISLMLGDPIVTGDGNGIVVQDVPGSVTGSSYGEAVSIDLRSGTATGRIKQQGQLIATDMTGRRIATHRFEQDDTTSLAICDFKLQTCEAAIKGFKNMITAAAFSSKGNLIVGGSRDGEIGIRDSATPSPLLLRSLDGRSILSIAISPDESRIAVLDWGGTVTLYNRAGKRLVRLDTLDQSEDWIAYTDEGLFDGTPNAMDEISWKLSDDPLGTSLPLGPFFSDFFWPSLLGDIFRGVDPKPPVDPAIAFQVPSLRMLVADGQLKFQRVGSGLRACFQVTPNVAVQQAPGAKPIAYQDQYGYEVDPSDKNCRYRKAIDLHGEDPDLLLKRINTWTVPPGPLAPRAISLVTSSDLFVQTIAIGHYPAESEYGPLPLEYALPSAAAIREHFNALRQDSKKNPYHAIHVLDPLEDGNATSEAVASRIALVASQARPNDVVLLYLVGHGEESSAGGMFSFMTSDGKSSATPGVRQTAMTSAVLADLLRNIPAKRSIVIVDACQAGGAVETLSKIAEARARLDLQTNNNKDELGAHVIAATMPLDYAAAATGRTLSLLAEELLKQLDTADTVVQLENGLAKGLPIRSEREAHFAQVPVIRAIGVDFPLKR